MDKNRIFKEKGITLISLIVTIVVLLILAGTSIAVLTGENGLITRAQQAKKASEEAAKREERELEAIATQISKRAGLEGGKWNTTKEINEPDLAGTGLTPITFGENGQVIEVTDKTSNWYDYNTTLDGSSMWANAVTKDSEGNITGYFVWIPRYEYKITYTNPSNISQGGTIDVKFIPTSQTVADEGYIIHPAFTDGRANNFKQGEWDSEISGFWVAKYPAGYQANTITDNNGTLSTDISNAGETIVRSSAKYTCGSTNMVDVAYTKNTYMSYPVFKPLTYAYNMISIGDAYVLSQQVAKESNFYGLSRISDSHLMKNSEWGAVAYLTQSNYGRHKTEPYKNSYYNSESSPYKTAVTGMYGNGTETSATHTLQTPYYETEIGVKGSSTGNITGVYDLNGCVWERTAGYITNGHSNLSTYGSTFVAKGENNPDTDGYKTLSTKYATVYPYNDTIESEYENATDTEKSYSKARSNWKLYNSLQDTINKKYGYGDAILETSTQGSGASSWNSDYSGFARADSPFFGRGGTYYNTSNTGLFAFTNSDGHPSYNAGFRVVLVGV